VQVRQARYAAAKADDTNLEDLSFMDTMHSSWGRQPSIGELIDSITQLWHEMHTPLLTRSQFWLTHQGKDVFYYLAEQGHLLDEKRCVLAECTDAIPRTCAALCAGAVLRPGVLLAAGIPVERSTIHGVHLRPACVLLAGAHGCAALQGDGAESGAAAAGKGPHAA
jgi:hypothetical protein